MRPATSVRPSPLKSPKVTSCQFWAPAPDPQIEAVRLNVLPCDVRTHQVSPVRPIQSAQPSPLTSARCKFFQVTLPDHVPACRTMNDVPYDKATISVLPTRPTRSV